MVFSFVLLKQQIRLFDPLECEHILVGAFDICG